jgi:hypothetical protein
MRGKTPKANELGRLKMFLYGDSGAGKTTAAIQMPKPYVIDAERGSVHYNSIIADRGGAVYHTNSIDDAIEEVRSVLQTRHSFKTLVIDPITILESELMAQLDEKYSGDMRMWRDRDKVLKRLYNLLVQLDMNVVVTAHGKPEYGPGMSKLGTTFDGWRRLPYMFDLVVQIDRERSGKRRASVVKSRFPNHMPDGDTFEWSYDVLKDRFGQSMLERDATSTLLATAEQVSIFKGLLDELTESTKKKLGIQWVVSEYHSLEDMPSERIQKGIDIINGHLSK